MAVGGKLAEDLDRLYEFSIDQITQSNSTRTAIGVTNALKVIRTLKEGWDVAIPG
jgi:flagellin-specific chaperone FliS